MLLLDGGACSAWSYIAACMEIDNAGVHLSKTVSWQTANQCLASELARLMSA